MKGNDLSLPGNVSLSQGAKLMAAEGLLGGFVVFDAEAENGFALGLGKERVEVIDIQLGFEQGRHEAIQIGGGGLDNQQVALGERKALAHEEFSGAVGVVHNNSNDGAVGGVENHESKDVDALRAQQPNQIMQASEPVSGEDGKLDDGIDPPHFCCLCCHSALPR